MTNAIYNACEKPVVIKYAVVYRTLCKDPLGIPGPHEALARFVPMMDVVHNRPSQRNSAELKAEAVRGIPIAYQVYINIATLTYRTLELTQFQRNVCPQP